MSRLRPRSRWSCLACAALVVSLLAACGGTASSASVAKPSEGQGASTVVPADSRLAIALSEWAVKPDRPNVRAGTLIIAAENLGALPHDLVILKTDADPRALAVVDGRVDETRVEVVGRFREFKAGEKEKTFALEPGSYLLICNLTAHYEKGMVAPLRVN